MHNAIVNLVSHKGVHVIWNETNEKLSKESELKKTDDYSNSSRSPSHALSLASGG